MASSAWRGRTLAAASLLRFLGSGRNNGQRKSSYRRRLAQLCNPPSDRCHLYDAAVQIERPHRNDPAIREVHVVKRTIVVNEDLPASAGNLLKLRQKQLEITGGQSEQEPIVRPI